MSLTQVAPAQANAHIPINEAFATVDGLLIGARNAATSTGLTWGYHGGRWAGTLVADGTLALPGGVTVYVVLANATGAISQSTATTNWNDSTNYRRLYKLTTNLTGNVTAIEDWRMGGQGLFR